MAAAGEGDRGVNPITEPGLYPEITAEAYHADPVMVPSLSSTGARTLVAECPAVYWHQRQNAERKRVFDIGTAGHLMVLEPESFDSRVRVIDADDYKKQAARDARDQAYADGLTPLLASEADMVRAMRDVLYADPIARHAFEGGRAEQTMIWRDRESGTWCRSRPDYLPPHARYLVDYKTSTSANPRQFEKALWDYGYFQQAAWYLDGAQHVLGARPERFAFVVQSKKPPYLVSVCWLAGEALEWGDVLNQHARRIFADCLRRDEWPAYRADVTENARRAFTVNLPAWAQRELQARQDAGEFTPPNMEQAA
jgi:hypothetical protein